MKTSVMKLLLGVLMLLQFGDLQSSVKRINIVIEQLRGNNYVQALNMIGQVEFREVDNTMHTIIVFKDSLSSEYDCGIVSHDVEKISFREGANKRGSVSMTSNSNVPLDNISVSVYPNPTSSNIHIDGLIEGQDVRLFDTEGKMILSTMESDINLSGLSSGVYLLQIGKQLIKITKK